MVKGRVTGVIFAKRSERFPGKHSIKVFESTLIDIVASRLMESRYLSSVHIFSKDPEIRSDLCDVDLDQSKGNIVSSILSALELYGDIFAVGGDMPCIDLSIVDSMLQAYDGKAIVPQKEDHTFEPLHAIYCAETRQVLENNISTGKLSIMEYVTAVPHSFFHVPKNKDFSFYNVNYPSDLVYIQRNGCM